MSGGRRVLEKLERSLFEAWKSDERVAAPGDDWHPGVMREIRTTSILGPEPGTFEARSPLVLRFSAATAALTIIVIIFALFSEMMPYRDLALLIMNDYADLFLSPPFV